MSFDAGALVFQIKTAGYQTTEQQLDALDRRVQGVGKSGADAAPKVEKLGKASAETGKKSKALSDDIGTLEKQVRSEALTSETAAQKLARLKQEQAEAAEAARKLAAALTIAGVAVAAVVGLSVAKYAEFDQAMSNTSAAVMATAQEQKDLSEAALKAGADTAYSASEAAAAEEELAKAGQSVSDIVGGSLNGALALAAAGQLQVARSAEIMATTLTQFRLPAEQAAHVSDVLAAGAGKAQGSVDDLALALGYVGPLAASAGWNLNETAGTIAYFATQGIIGEKAGTSLRGVLAALQAPSAAAAGVMNEYGISVYDANGKMLSAAGLAEQLKQKLGGLTDQERQAALGRIFGNESLLAATLLYEGGAKKIEEWTAAVDDTGYAAEQAAKRQDNLAGDVEKLGGAFDTALIRTGSGANDVLREMVQSVTALVDWYGELPGPIQATSLVVGVATAAMLLFAGSAVGLRVKFAELKAAMDVANISMTRTAIVGAAAGLALTGVVTVIAILAQQQAEAQQRAQAYADTLEKGTNQITRSTRELAVANLQAEKSVLWMNRGSAFDAAEKLGVDLNVLTDAALGSSAALDKLSLYTRVANGDQEALNEVVKKTGLSQAEAADAIDVMLSGLRNQSGALVDAKRKQEQADSATKANTDSTKTAADAYIEAADSVDQMNKKLRDLIDTISAANKIGQDAITKNIDYQDALAKVDEQIRKAQEGADGYSATLDVNTQAGRDNLDMLVNAAEKAQAAAKAQFDLDQNTGNYRATLESSRQALIDRATQLGYNSEQAGALADQIFRIPSETEWTVIANTTRAAQEMQRWFQEWSGKTVTIDAVISQHPAWEQRILSPVFQADGGIMHFASGGTYQENHVAQFARAGTYRVWAEPETGGEAYIPLAESKRARSTQVLTQVANQFGYQLVPAGERPSDGSSPAVDFSQMSGMSITGTLEIGGDGLARIINGRIASAQQASYVRLTGGEASL